VAIVFAAMRLVPNSRVTAAKRHFDIAGATSVTAGLVLLVYSIVKAPEWGWTSASTLGLGALAIALIVAFVMIERVSPAPLVRLSLLKMRSLATANGVFVIIIGGLFAMFFFASLYLQNILDYSPLQTGLAFLPVTAGIMIGAVLSQQLISRVGVRPVLFTGMTVATIGLGILAATTKVDGNYLGVLGGLLPMSIGMGATFVPMTLVATTNVDADDAGLASGIFNTSQQVGGALGLAILSTLANDRTMNFLADLGGKPSLADQQAALVEGFQLAFIAAAVLMAIGGAIAAVFLRKSDLERIEAGETTVPVAA
jgi:predicted MFS family arabinose efflux permease